MAEPLEELVVKIGAEDTGLEDQVSRIGDMFEFAFAEKVANSVADAGKHLEDFARAQAPLTEQTRGLARQLGLQEDEVRELAASLTDVTRPLDQVLDTMELGRQQGIKNTDQLSDFVVAWDTVGDATGENADALAKSGVALRAFGLDATEVTDAFPAFGFILEETTLQVSDFQNMLSRVGPDLDGMNMSVDDAAAIVGILERDFGLAGKALNREFGTAVRGADGDLDTMLENLGITRERFEEMSGVVDESSGIIQRNADEFGATFTPMQKLQSQLEVLMYEYGTFAEVAATVAPVLMALGPIMKGVAAAKLILNAAFWASPITWIVLAIVAAIVVLVAIGYVVWKHWDTIIDALGAAWQWLWGHLKAFGDWFMRTFWQNGLKRVIDAIVRAVQAYVRFWGNAWSTVLNAAKSVISWVTGIPGMLRGAFSTVASIITSPFRTAFNSIANLWNRTVGSLSWSVPSWVPGIGGNSLSVPTIPTFHDGGVVPGSGEQLALVEGGEAVFTRDQQRALGAAIRGSDGDSVPTEFEATATIDLGEGIERVVDVKFKRRDRTLKQRVNARTGRRS